MGKISNKLAAFMYGRYGTDALNVMLTVLYLVIAIAQSFFDGIIAIILFFVSLLLIAIVIFRMMSKNIAKRRRENAPFIRLGAKIKNARDLSRNKKRDRKTHVYRKCPKCKAVLRLPRVKGKHTATCPKCKNKLKVSIKR
ncbi:MAG: hypothetical protein IKA82_02725 [Clostridia bacterium]|nr:hypothetical protein [Clostridia bacterium]